MQQTTKYQFNLIEGGDDFSPNPLNENMEKVEAALTEQAKDFAAALGSGGSTCRIAYGSYKGTGAYGPDNPVKLTFDFAPQLVFVGYIRSNIGSVSTLIRPLSSQYPASTSYPLFMTWGANSLQWYANDSAEYALNVDSRNYYYAAIGS